MSSSEHCRRVIFQIYNVQNLKITRITTFHICNVVYQAGSRRDPKCVFNFLRFFERTLYKSNYIIFILSWCGTHTKIRSKLADIVTAGSQSINLWGPQRTLLGILRVKAEIKLTKNALSVMSYTATRLKCLYGKCVNSDHRGSVVHYRQGKEIVLSSKVFKPVLGPTCVILNGNRR